MGPGSVARIDQILRDLGLPPDYALQRGFTLQPEVAESELVVIGRNASGRDVRLVPPAANAWERMRAAAANDGLTLQPLSGFRSVTRQEEIIRRKLSAGQPLAGILRLVAAPGYSEHHTGRAVDVGTPGEPPLEESFAGTAAFRWLLHHARQSGFRLSYPRDNPHGIAYEPWHWCWQPDPAPVPAWE
jgi:D-alanyl-D-alanine carboxypeptidase